MATVEDLSIPLTRQVSHQDRGRLEDTTFVEHRHEVCVRSDVQNGGRGCRVRPPNPRAVELSDGTERPVRILGSDLAKLIAPAEGPESPRVAAHGLARGLIEGAP